MVSQIAGKKTHTETRALLRLERTMNLLEGGKGGEWRMGERGWRGNGGRVGRGRGGEREGGERGRVMEREGGRGGKGKGRGGEGRDDGYTYCNRYVH